MYVQIDKNLPYIFVMYKALSVYNRININRNFKRTC